MPINLAHTDPFARRHIGPGPADLDGMLATIGFDSLDALIDATVPAAIRLDRPLDLAAGLGEHAALARLREIADANEVWRSYIGMGYSGTLTPPVILRNILENPGWYTQYTPYQAEIAQGRLEALLNYQTMVTDLAGMEIANASLLDEGTAAAEAMGLAWSVARQSADKARFFVSEDCHLQTIDVVRTRAEPLGITVVVGDHRSFEFDATCFGALLQYPCSDGRVEDYRGFCERAHAADALVVVAADLLSLTLLAPPGDWGADVVVGNTQRFGVPMGYGGPHAAFFATREAYKRQMPGRLIGVTVDANGNTAFRMALQTREQHIRREKATSNICTAQVLLAVMAGMYGVWHGPRGLRRMAQRVHGCARVLALGLENMGHKLMHTDFFDTLRVDPEGLSQGDVHTAAEARRINLRYYADGTVGIALDETVTESDLADILAIFDFDEVLDEGPAELAATLEPGYQGSMPRQSEYMTHPIFDRFHSETEMMRYIKHLEGKDLSLTHSMIPLGSCTMKLNAAAELFGVTWPEFGQLHPFVPTEQAEGYRQLFDDLERWLAEITGLPAVSLQPNSGAQGEYAGLQVIRAWHRSRGDEARTVCLIPSSAHGTNPASAVMAGMDVVVVATDAHGNVDIEDLRAKAALHADKLAALMITYPSTHGVFETGIREICDIIHAAGGQVYMDGANMNAQVGLCRPGDFGADVLHLNLHKTFAIPHGGGGPGMGPICAVEHLAPFLPGHPVVATGGDGGLGPISAAPWGSASILVISWMYIVMLGREGVTDATRYAILNANYMAARLRGAYDVLFTGAQGTVAHEFILDLRELKAAAHISEMDVAKRLADYGFHAPTVSWPVAGTIMIEPTESESKVELDRLCDALLGIRAEIQALIDGRAEAGNNVLQNAPHTAAVVMSDTWDRPYTREQAAFPTAWTRDAKFWPSVGRVDDVYGDRNLICACPPIESYYAEDAALVEGAGV
jgi:glycine dehydrogenase